MKKLANILTITFILLFFYLTKDINILPLTISFSMYILFSSIFSTTSIKKVIEVYHDKKYYYSRNKILYYTLTLVTIIGLILTIISYSVGEFLNIEKINIINIFMTISLISNILLKIIKEYIEVIGYKKISNNLINLYKVVVLTINVILSILLFKVFKLESYINYIMLYSVSVIVFIIAVILLYILILHKKNKYNKKNEENKKINIKDVKKIIINNQIQTIYNITRATYIYISIIVLYYILTNKYNYSYDIVGNLITNTYFYGMFIFYYINKIIEKYLNIDYDTIKENFDSNINKITKLSLNLCILLAVISIPLNNLIFRNDYNILSSLIPLLFFYILYNYIININIKYNKDKKNLIILLLGIITKIIFELPLINSIYRMGFSLTLGSILSIILGMIVSIILGLIFIKSKFKLNLLNNFNNILNIVYESIIYCLILVLFTLIIKVDTVGIINSLLVVIFYIFITILFHIIKRILTKK